MLGVDKCFWSQLQQPDLHSLPHRLDTGSRISEARQRGTRWCVGSQLKTTTSTNWWEETGFRVEVLLDTTPRKAEVLQLWSVTAAGESTLQTTDLYHERQLVSSLPQMSPLSLTLTCHQVLNEISGALSMIEVFPLIGQVYGVNSNGDIYQRDGVSASNPAGTGWHQVQHPQKVKHVSYDPRPSVAHRQRRQHHGLRGSLKGARP
ncbi:hypothetical protein NFI96_030650 [Prochilodus magdalenae]|nr:hypothetical protein NFI96_030650 [Prochilodus magdalenae]